MDLKPTDTLSAPDYPAWENGRPPNKCRWYKVLVVLASLLSLGAAVGIGAPLYEYVNDLLSPTKHQAIWLQGATPEPIPPVPAPTPSPQHTP